jgi:hypothetical protein
LKITCKKKGSEGTGRVKMGFFFNFKPDFLEAMKLTNECARISRMGKRNLGRIHAGKRKNRP